MVTPPVAMSAATIVSATILDESTESVASFASVTLPSVIFAVVTESVPRSAAAIVPSTISPVTIDEARLSFEYAIAAAAATSAFQSRRP